MKRTQLFIKTLKQAPADEVAINAQLLIRAGFVHKEMAGVYAFTPLGLRVLENVKRIIREEMNSVGGVEVMMTTLQSRDLWEKTDRWDDAKVDNWFKTHLANGSELGIGFTHEEPIVDMLKDYVSSYKDLPVTMYQIQSKFRNEKRAKSGLMRGREFIMKDMYSFARTQEEHEKLYEEAVAAYLRVFDRVGLGEYTYRTYADGGVFTDKFSDEFQVISPVGEDTIYADSTKKVAVNEEVKTDVNLQIFGLAEENLSEQKSIEVGNTFHLETKYTDALGLKYTDEHGEQQPIIMGCYGIGVSRLVGAIAEHFSDDKGLVWPRSVAPYQVYLVQIGKESVKAAEDLYRELSEKGVEVLYDDRDERPGKKFADAELMGIPMRITVSDRLEEDNKIEVVDRTSGEQVVLTRDELFAKIG